ncbi:hypothetical protein IWQ61_007897, partial [Dispira simplex]
MASLNKPSVTTAPLGSEDTSLATPTYNHTMRHNSGGKCLPPFPKSTASPEPRSPSCSPSLSPEGSPTTSPPGSRKKLPYNLDNLHPDDARDKVFVAIIKALLIMGNKPSSPKELANCIMKQRFTILGGATPYATVSSRISQHFKRASEHKPPRKPILGRAVDSRYSRKIHYYLATDDSPPVRLRTPPPSSQSPVLPATATPAGVSGSGKKRQPRPRPGGSVSSKRPRLTTLDHIFSGPSLPSTSASSPVHLSSEPEMEENAMNASSQLHRLVRSISAYDEPPFNDERPFNMPIPGRGKWVPRYTQSTSTGSSVAATRTTSPERQSYNGAGPATVALSTNIVVSSATNKYPQESGDGLPISPAPSPPVSSTASDRQKTFSMAPPDVYCMSNMSVSDETVDFHEEMMSGHLADNVSPLILPTNPPPASRTSRASSPVPLVNLHEEIEPLLLQVQARQNYRVSRKGSAQLSSTCRTIKSTHLTPTSSHTSRNASTEDLNPSQTQKGPANTFHPQEGPGSQDDRIFTKKSSSPSKALFTTSVTTSASSLGPYPALADVVTTPRRNPPPPSSTIISGSPFGPGVFWQTSPLPFDSIFAAFPSHHRREGCTPLDSDITEKVTTANERPLSDHALHRNLQGARDKVPRSLSVPTSDPDDLEMVFNEPSSVSPSLVGSDDEDIPPIVEEADRLRLESLSLEADNTLREPNSGSGDNVSSSGPVPIRIQTTGCEPGIALGGVSCTGSSYGSFGGLNEFHDPEAMSLSEIEQLWASPRCKTGGLPSSETNPTGLEVQKDSATLHCRCIGGPLIHSTTDDVRGTGKVAGQFLNVLGRNKEMYSDTITDLTPRQRSLSTSEFVWDRLHSSRSVKDFSDKEYRKSLVSAIPFRTRSRFRSNATPLEPVLEHEVASELNIKKKEGTTDWALICSSSLPNSLSNLSLKTRSQCKPSAIDPTSDDTSHRRVSNWLAATQRQDVVLSTLANDSRKRYSSREALLAANGSRINLNHSGSSSRISHRLSRSFTNEQLTPPLWLTNLRSYELGNQLLTTPADTPVNRSTCSGISTQNKPHLCCLSCGRVCSNRESNPTGKQVTATNESPGSLTTQGGCPSDQSIGTTADTSSGEGIIRPGNTESSCASVGSPDQDQSPSPIDWQVKSPASVRANTTDTTLLEGFVDKIYGDIRVQETVIEGTGGKLMQVIGSGSKPPMHAGRRSTTVVSSQLKPDDHLGYVNATQLRRAARVTLGEGKLDLRDAKHRLAVALRTGPQESRGLWVPSAVARELMIEFKLTDRPEVQIFLAAIKSPSLSGTDNEEGVDAMTEDGSSASHSSPTLSTKVPMVEDDEPVSSLSLTSAELTAKGQDRSAVFGSRSVTALRSTLPLITPSALTTRSLLTAISALAKAKGSAFNLPTAALESDLSGLFSSAPSALAKSISSGGDGGKQSGSGSDDSTDMTSSSFASTFSSLLASTLNSRPSSTLSGRISSKDTEQSASTISTNGATPAVSIGTGGQIGEEKTISPFTALLNRTIAALQKHRQQQQLQKQLPVSSALDTILVMNTPASKATPPTTETDLSSSKGTSSSIAISATTSTTAEGEATESVDTQPKLKPKPSTQSSQDQALPTLLGPETQTLGKSSAIDQAAVSASSSPVLSEKGGKKPRVISASYAAALAARSEAEGEDTPPPRPDCIPTRINVTPRIYLTLIESTPFYIVAVGPRQGFKRSHTLLRRADTGYVNAERLLNAGGVESDQEKSIVLSLEVDRYRYPSADSELYGSWIPLPRARALAATCSLHHKLGPFLNDNLQTYFPVQLPPAYAKLVRCRPLPPLDSCYGLARTTSALSGLRSAFGRDRGPILRFNALGTSTLLGGTLSDAASSTTGLASPGVSEMLAPPSSLYHLFANKGETPSYSALTSSSPLTLGRSVSFQQPIGLSGSTTPSPLGTSGKGGEGNALAQLNQLLHAESKKATAALDHVRSAAVETLGGGKPTKVIGTTSLPLTGRQELPFYLATALSMANTVGEAVNVVTPQALQKNTANWSPSVDLNATADTAHTGDELGQSERKPRR